MTESDGPAPTEVAGVGMVPEAPPSHSGSEGVRKREMALAVGNGLKMGGSLLITWSVALIVKLDVPAHLGPIRQGHFGFAEGFAAMFFAATSLGIDVHIMKECAVRPQHASEVVGGVFALRAAMSVLIILAMAVVLWVTGGPLEAFLTALVFGMCNVMSNASATLGAVLTAISKCRRD